MQWSCPHCGVSLTVSDDTLGTGWSFSRCYKCGGFALIRKAEINIIKVDKAPPGERIILPEASPNPPAALKAGIETRRKSPAADLNTEHPQAHASPPDFHFKNNKASPFETIKNQLPEALPENPTSTRTLNKIPIGIAATGTLAAISGIYLYLQGQSLWLKTRSTLNGHPEIHAKKEIIPPPTVLSADATPQEKPLTVAHDVPVLPRTLITDQVQQSAMAPLKAIRLPLTETPQNAPSTSPHSWLVKIGSKQANVHSGPGLNFPIIGKVDAETSYLVGDWNNRWFKLLTPHGTKPITVGWIRNDLVEGLPKSAE